MLIFKKGIRSPLYHALAKLEQLAAALLRLLRRGGRRCETARQQQRAAAEGAVAVVDGGARGAGACDTTVDEP
jgi:hypothetical protein